jgi:hypothetical protein
VRAVVLRIESHGAGSAALMNRAQNVGGELKPVQVCT